MTNKYKLDYTTAFKRDVKKARKRGYDLKLLEEVVNKLAGGEPLDEKHRDHSLKGGLSMFRECHIQPDWLLVYQIIDDTLVLSLVRTGTHSDLDLY